MSGEVREDSEEVVVAISSGRGGCSSNGRIL